MKYIISILIGLYAALEAQEPSFPRSTLDLLVKLEQFEHTELTNTSQRITDKRHQVTRILEQHLKDLTKSGDLDRALKVRKKIQELQIPLQLTRSKAKVMSPTKKTYIPKTAHRGPGGYYLWIEKQVSWPEAQEECQKMGGNLVSINSEKEWEQVLEYRKKAGAKGKRFWIGLTRNGGPEVPFQWVDGTESTFTNWGNRQPPPKKAQKLGTQVSSGAEWYAYHLAEKPETQGFICEWKRE